MSQVMLKPILLWAQAGPRVMEHLRPKNTSDLNSLLVALVLILAVIGICLMASRFVAAHQRRRGSSPRRLFKELCRAHGLTWRERQMLVRLAAWHGLAHPMTLFVEPKRFHIEAVELKPYHQSLGELHAKLFL